VALKNYFELSRFAAGAPIDEIRKRFVCRSPVPSRQGPASRKEFQSMAATAPPLTAIRFLRRSRRAEYDRAVADAGGLPTSAAAPGRRSRSRLLAAFSRPAGPPPTSPPSSTDRQTGPQFKQERASRDEFVRKRRWAGCVRRSRPWAAGTTNRRSAASTSRACEEEIFASNKNPRLLGRFISRLDREAVADAWKEAAKWGVPGGEDVCVLLMAHRSLPQANWRGDRGPAQTAVTQGRQAHADSCRRARLGPHMPFDAPEIAKTLLAGSGPGRSRVGNNSLGIVV